MSTNELNREEGGTMTKHPDTIGEIEWDGKTYQIDWPFDLDDETTRDDFLGVIYLDGELVGEFNEPFGALTNATQVMRLAWECIASGETDDQS